MIRAYVGGLGAGKTLRMVDDARQLVIKERRPIYTNMSGLHFPEAIYIPDVRSLEHISKGCVILDEAAVCLSSRYWRDIDPETLSAFRQARKHGLDLFYTSQGVEHVDKVVRDITNEISVCRKIGRGDRPSDSRTRYGAVRYSPDMKKLLGRKLTGYPKSVYALYSTHEKISRTGGGGAEGNLRDFPQPLYAMIAQQSRIGGDGYLRDEVFDRPVFRWWGRRGWLTRPARRALDWLLDGGYLSDWQCDKRSPGLDPKSGWVAVVAKELKRRAWLAAFGLSADDAPYRCRYDSPWAYGFEPEYVKRRRDEEEAEEALRIAAMKAAGRGSRSGLSVLAS